MTEETTPLTPSEPDVPAVDEEGAALPDDVQDGEVAPEDEPAGAEPDNGTDDTEAPEPEE